MTWARRAPRAETHPQTHAKGQPSPRSAAKRAPRTATLTAAALTAIAAILWPAEGSALQKLHPKTVVEKVLDHVPMPNHARGTFQVILAAANSRTCQCAWRSYEDFGERIERSGRQAVDNTAVLEGFGVIHVETFRAPPRRGRAFGGNKLNTFTVKVPEWVREQAWKHLESLRASGTPLPDLDDLDLDLDEADLDEADAAPAADPDDIAAARAELEALHAKTQASTALALVTPAAPPVIHAPPAPAHANAHDIDVLVDEVQRPLPPLPPLTPAAKPATAKQQKRARQMRAAVLELVMETPELQHGGEILIERVVAAALRNERSIARVLVGLLQCADKSAGKTPSELANWANACINSDLANVSELPPVARRIVRRIERDDDATGPPT